MKNVLYGLMLLSLVACGHKEAVTIIPGAAGANGADGAAGANGHSLVSETVSAGWCECDEQGGQRLDIYMDMDDSLSVSEGDTFSSSLIACNGYNGLNGANGLDGAVGAQGVPGAAGPVGAAGANGTNGANGAPGPAGAVGAAGANGAPGPVGPAGPQGPQGVAGAVGPTGAGATLQNFALSTSSCTSLSDGYWAKKSGTDAKLYSNSTCTTFIANVYSEHTSNGEASVWLSATRLAFNDGAGNLRVIKFN